MNFVYLISIRKFEKKKKRVGKIKDVSPAFINKNSYS